MKKGFTLIEIIISIVLILIIGTSATVFVFNNKSDSELEDITKQILEAANLYANKEVDENGNIYINEVKKDKKGVQIPLTNLVNKGYIKEEEVNRVKELTNDENYYIMLLEGTPEGYDYCGDEKIFSLASWTYNGNDVYLCDNEYNNNTNNLYNKIKNMDYYTQCDKTTSSGLCFLKAHEGLVDENTDGTLSDVYYFRGNAENNYLKFNGLDKIFRIVRTTENNGVKIIDSSRIRNWIYSKYPTHSLWYNDVNKWDLDGYKITNFVSNGVAFDDCENADDITSWDDSDIVVCKANSYSTGYNTWTKEINSPIYLYLYTPLLNMYNYNKTVIENYIDKDYKWCTSSNVLSSISTTTFKCQVEKTLDTDFAILNLFEYENIHFLNSNDAFYYGYDLSSGPCDDTSEIAFGDSDGVYINTRKLLPDLKSYCTSEQNINIRPTYVIKGNSKIVDGDGTVDNPFIIDGFIN